MDRLISLAAYLAAIFFLLVLMACLFIATGALAHDIYNGVYGRGGNLCCGGDPVTGDCEALASDQVHERNGSVVIDSKRYGHPVLVPQNRIVWGGLPGEVPGTAGHWCGKPRAETDSEVDDNQPDPSFRTFCAFIAPGGV